MIEVKNLKKTYVTKGGNVTKALDDVSIKFPDKGLIFLLGKSGSGKSTLLNVMGGLDKADSGEVLIMGRSSKSFSSSDFDSYRNTFIGFIFQEYNILNEFSIYENLSLALELQGKKANKERVLKLLDDVDLKGFEKRKPNTLSGGQKQRIAIARALIKEPKIIMADEPTGALDSKTGKQVFDTLKKLSQDHLVIVVSHDREFAEIYGDRIIELKDGKVLSDEVKTHIEAEKLNDNISIIGKNTLSIKSGTTLTEKDKKDILEFISKNDNDIIISKSEDDVKSFKKANRISDDNKKESFKETKDNDIDIKEYDSKDSKFIKSKLPLSKAIRMGLSSLKIKPFRLFITMLLTIISFVLFGVASTLMNFNSNTVLKNSFKSSEYKTVAIENNYYYDTTSYHNNKEDYSYSSTGQTVFTEEDLSKFNKYGNNILPIFSLGYKYDNIRITNISFTSDAINTLTQTEIRGLGLYSDTNTYSDLVIGSAPTDVLDIIISEYYSNVLLKSDLITSNNVSDLIGKELTLSLYNTSITFTIKGIYKGDEMPSKYSDYNQDSAKDWDQEKTTSFQTYIKESLDKILLISKDTYKYIIEKTGFKPSTNSDYNRYFKSCKSYYFEYNDNTYYLYGMELLNNATLDIKYFDENESHSNGIVIDYNVLVSYITSHKYTFNDIFEKYIDNFKTNYLKYFNLYLTYELECIYNTLSSEDKINYFNENYKDYYTNERLIYMYNMILDLYPEYQTNIDELKSDSKYIASKEKVEQDFDAYYNYISYTSSDLCNLYSQMQTLYIGLLNKTDYLYTLNNFNLSYLNLVSDDIAYVIYYLFDSGYIEKSINITIDDSAYASTFTRNILGFYIKNGDNYLYGTYFSEQTDYDNLLPSYYSKTSTKYELKESEYYYSYIYVNTSNGKIFDDLNVRFDNDSFYKIDNSLYQNVTFITSFVSILKDVFLYVGIVLAVFSSLLLFNFITVSISNKTHEIGVLRAIGARGKDVFKIFFSESLFISLLAFLIALIGAILIVIQLNIYITSEIGYSLHLLSFGPLSLLFMLGIAILVAVIATFIPVTIIAHKKPVDSLRTL